MPSFFSKVLGRKDGGTPSIKSAKGAIGPQTNVRQSIPPKRTWEDAWQRKEVEPEEVQELLRGCTLELKSRALDLPFLLLPFRPTSDPSAARTFIRTYFDSERNHSGGRMQIGQLQHELRLTEPMVLCSVIKWCWSRLPGGVVTWDAYELFRVGEQDSDLARDAFATFIPLSVDSDARTKIIFDFFDLMAAVAAHGKANGLSGRKLSRLAGWWAFDHSDGGDGFEGGYRSWAKAADATSHLFFAYLRSLSPNSVRGTNGISALPLSLQMLVQDTEYPPESSSLMQSAASKVVMIVTSVSPTPFALLRRAKHFEYREDDAALQAFANLDDPVKALTEECRRVMRCISSTNQSDATTAKDSTGAREPSWSRFEDLGFSSSFIEEEPEKAQEAAMAARRRGDGMRSAPRSRTTDVGRPTTPSWADFLSAGFVDEPTEGPAPLMLPPDKILPPIDTYRGHSSQSRRHAAQAESNLEPGELASITRMDIEDCFWWVWITSLAGEETSERKAVFGRCALVETNIARGRWLVIEEKVKGAASPPEEGAYTVEKKSRFGISKRGKMTRGKASSKKEHLAPPPPPAQPSRANPGASKTSIGPDQHARIQAAAAILQKKQADQTTAQLKRGRTEETAVRTNSVFTLQPVIMNEAAPAMQWASKFDRDAIREQYLGDYSAGKGSQLTLPLAENKTDTNGSTAHVPEDLNSDERQLPALPGASSVEPAAPLPRSDVVTAHPVTSAVSDKGMQDSAEKLVHPVGHPATEPVSTPAAIEPNVKSVLSTSNSSTPEKIQGKKLKKGGAGGGLKKLFHMKKTEEPVVPDTPVVEEQRSTLQVPTRSALGRLSSLRQKSTNESLPPHSPSPSQVPHDIITASRDDHPSKTPVERAETVLAANPHEPSVAEPNQQSNLDLLPSPHHTTQEVSQPGMIVTDSHGPVQAYRPGAINVQKPAPAPSYSQEAMPPQVHQPYHEDSYDPSSSQDTEEAHAARAFSSFGQGPLEGVPAFVPADSPRRRDSPVVATSTSSRQAEVTRPVAPTHQQEPVRPVEPIQQEAPAPIATAESIKSASPDQGLAPVQDRWAKIRANAAASRAAANESPEQETPPAVAASKTAPPPVAPKTRSPGPEIPGDESIESRVARIKARVAELTSNMDTDAATRPTKL